MSAYETRTIVVPATVTQGEALDVGQLVDKWLTIHGTWTGPAEVDIQVSQDNGTTWFVPANLDGLTGDVVEPIEVPHAVTHMRADTKAGTPALTCVVRGMELSKTPPVR